MSNGNDGNNQTDDSEELPDTAVGQSKGKRPTLLGHPPRRKTVKRRSKSPIDDAVLSRLYRRQLAMGYRIGQGTLCPTLCSNALQDLLDGKILTPKSLMPDLRTQVNMAIMINRTFGLGVSEATIKLGLSDAEQLVFENRLNSLRPNQAYVFTLTFGEIGVCLEKLWEVIKSMHVGYHNKFDFKQCVRERFRSGFNVSAGSFELVDFGSPAESASIQDIRFGLGSKQVLSDIELFWALIYNPRLLLDLCDHGFKGLWVGNVSIPGGPDSGRNSGDVPLFVPGFNGDCISLYCGCDASNHSERSIPRTVVQ